MDRAHTGTESKYNANTGTGIIFECQFARFGNQHMTNLVLHSFTTVHHFPLFHYKVSLFSFPLHLVLNSITLVYLSSLNYYTNLSFSSLSTSNWMCPYWYWTKVQNASTGTGTIECQLR